MLRAVFSLRGPNLLRVHSELVILFLRTSLAFCDLGKVFLDRFQQALFPLLTHEKFVDRLDEELGCSCDR